MNGALHTVDGRSVPRFERRLAHAPEKVWQTLTEPAQLARWFPCAIEGDRALGGRLRFVFRDGEGPTPGGVITALDPPRLLEYTWASRSSAGSRGPSPRAACSSSPAPSTPPTRQPSSPPGGTSASMRWSPCRTDGGDDASGSWVATVTSEPAERMPPGRT